MMSTTVNTLFFTRKISFILALYSVATLHFLTIPLLGLENTIYSYSTGLYTTIISIAVSFNTLFTVFKVTRSYVALSALHKSAIFFATFLFASGFASLIFFIYNTELNITNQRAHFVDLFYIIACFCLVFSMSYYINGVEKKSKTIPIIHVFFIIAPIVFVFFVAVAYSFAIYSSLNNGDSLGLPAVNIFYVATVLVAILFVIRFVYLWFSRAIKESALFLSMILFVGFLFLYVGDLLLAYAKAHNIFYIGNWNDFIFLTAFSLLSIFLSHFVQLLNKEEL